MSDTLFGATKWCVTASHATSATATKDAVAGKRHYITGIIASAVTPTDGASITLRDGTTTLIALTGPFTGSQQCIPIIFGRPIELTENSAASLIVADGSAISVKANLLGFTR